MAVKAYSKNSETEYIKSYDGVRGVSLGGYDATRFSTLENLYVDYEGDGAAIESIPGFRRIYSLGERVNGMFSQKVGEGMEYILVHAGTSLYRFEKDERDFLDSLTPIGTLRDNRSCAFCYGESIYILDGEGIYCINRDGEFLGAGSEGFTPYVPTVYKNGKPYEERNLLTNEFREIYEIGNSEMDYYSTPELVFSPTDYLTGLRTCEVIGVNDSFSGELFIPKYTMIGGERYLVTEIHNGAFVGNSKITAVWTSLGLEKIHDYAFFNCENIKYINISNTVTFVGSKSFFGIKKLETAFIGKSVRYLGTAAFGYHEDALFAYNGSEEDLVEKVENYEILTQQTLFYNKIWPRIAIAVKLHSPVAEISAIKVNGVTQTSYGATKILLEAPVYDSESQVLRLIFVRRSDIDEGVIEICGTLRDEETKEDGLYPDFFSSPMGKRLPPDRAVLGCRCASSYDGRIFLSGNPQLGGTVFYTALKSDGTVSPLYFGSRSYFLDGVGDYTVTSLITSRESLIVLKNGDDGAGSIFYHSVKDSGVYGDRYPVSYVHGGVCVRGSGCTFFDEDLFLCDAGLCTLEKSSSSYRSIRSLSSAVNQRLLSCDLDAVSTAGWCGYLALCANGSILLADTRGGYSGTKEYDWYCLSTIGTYEGDTPLYRYSSSAPEGFLTHADTDTEVKDTVMSVGDEIGELIYYTEKDGVRYAVYPTMERTGGTFRAATLILGCGNLLFFATEN